MVICQLFCAESLNFFFCITSLIWHFGIQSTFFVILQRNPLSIFYSWGIYKPLLPKFSTLCNLSLYTLSQLYTTFPKLFNFLCMFNYVWLNFKWISNVMFLDLVHQTSGNLQFTLLHFSHAKHKQKKITFKSIP